METIVSWLVLTYTNPGELVFDPLAGSGMTSVTCKETGRRGLGMERDNKYYSLAINRLLNTTI